MLQLGPIVQLLPRRLVLPLVELFRGLFGSVVGAELGGVLISPVFDPSRRSRW